MTKNKPLIFIDIDGTLVNSDQKTNSGGLRPLVKQLASAGFLFGINSNRSVKDIEPIYNRFDFSGPLIAENGVCFIYKNKKHFFHQKPKKISALTKQYVSEYATNTQPPASFYFGDTVSLLKNHNNLKKPLVIMANSFRQYTGSIHLFKNGQRDIVLASKLANYLKLKFRRNRLTLTVEVSKSSGNVTFYPSQTNKAKAIQKIKAFFSKRDIIMIGNGLSDLKILPFVKYFCAVGNALPEVKKQAHLVTQRQFTQGVIELLKQLAKKYC